ncbi:hypothetical protein, partial [Verrucomicrobium spinosum]|uniref:hypothetical protein n=1 Tax=Verrucomicrobium spinosum TaxID=2736 RepID=UPI000A7D458A
RSVSPAASPLISSVLPHPTTLIHWTQMETKPAVPIKIATLDERLKASAAVPWEDALAAMKKQAGYKTDRSQHPGVKALAYLESMEKRSPEA